MSDRDRRAFIALAIVALLALAVRPVAAQVIEHRPGAAAAGAPEITPEVRAATLHFDPAVSAADRAWIVGAIAAARPEAQRLIAEVDGMVEVRTDLNAPGAISPGGGQAIGLADMTGDQAMISLDVRELDGER